MSCPKSSELRTRQGKQNDVVSEGEPPLDKAGLKKEIVSEGELSLDKASPKKGDRVRSLS
jgi:hypothetical protein